MALSKEDIQKHISVLHIDVDVESVTRRDVNVAFRKLALILHPDKAGSKSTAAFQEILDSCNLLLDHFDSLGDKDRFDNDDDERFFKDNFKRFNFPFENKGSFTVSIEDYLADTWQECISVHLGEPKVFVNAWGTECDRSWKVQYGEETKIDITVHIYNKPKNKKGSKIMLQGSIQSLICAYVFKELPMIYKMVCDRKPKSVEIISNQKKKAIAKPCVKCDQCNFKSSMVQMKKHIQNMHVKKANRGSKRLFNFTPIAKPSKKSKSASEVISYINSEGIMDESIFLMSDVSSLTETNLEEATAEPVQAALDNVAGPVEKCDIFSCDQCEFDTEIAGDLKEHTTRGIHMIGSTESFTCQECNFSFKNELQLKKHLLNAHTKHADLETAFLCGQCNLSFESLLKCQEHVDAHLYKCYKCNFESKNSVDVMKHEKNEHELFNCESSSNIKCSYCDYVSSDKETLLNHTSRKHGLINCDKCEYSALDEGIMKKHMYKHTGRMVYQCRICEFEATKQEILENHIEVKHNVKEVETPRLKCERCENYFGKPFQLKHHSCKVQSKYQCEQCTFLAVTLSELLDHIEVKHPRRRNISSHMKKPDENPSEKSEIKCDQCEFIAEDISVYVKHLITEHAKEQCQFCEHVSSNKEGLRNHMYEKHEEVVIMHTMAQQINNVSESFELFETFKKELANVLKSLLDNQNTIMQDLFILKNNQAELSNKKKCIESNSTSHEPTKPTKTNEPRRSARPAPSTNKQQQQEKKILFVGDSISRNVDIERLQDVTQSKIVTARAYSSIYDTVENVAKKSARFPGSNFTDVVPAELRKGDYQTLVLQAGSVDITNLNTKDNPTNHAEYFRQETVMSARNFFQAGLNALSSSPSLEKVVLMKQIPRYDPATVDPLCIKPALSLLYNNTLTDLWMTSDYKDKIIIGNHNIDCTGAIREARYRQTKSNKFDGIHLYGSSGRKAYTLSVLNILRAAQLTSPEDNYHQSCAQHNYQERQTRFRQAGRQGGQKYRSKNVHSQNAGYNLPTQNRYDSLSGLNQGNC